MHSRTSISLALFMLLSLMLSNASVAQPDATDNSSSTILEIDIFDDSEPVDSNSSDSAIELKARSDSDSAFDYDNSTDFSGDAFNDQSNRETVYQDYKLGAPAPAKIQTAMIAPRIDPNKPLFQIDMVVFRSKGSAALRAEKWPENPGLPDIVRAAPLSGFEQWATQASSLSDVADRLRSSGRYSTITELSWVQNAAPRSAPLPLYLRAGVNVNGYAKQTLPGADVSINGQSQWPQLVGTVSFTAKRYHHFAIDLLYNYETAIPFELPAANNSFANQGLSGLSKDDQEAADMVAEIEFSQAPPKTPKVFQLGQIRLQHSSIIKRGKLQYFDHPVVSVIVNMRELSAENMPTLPGYQPPSSEAVAPPPIEPIPKTKPEPTPKMMLPPTPQLQTSPRLQSPPAQSAPASGQTPLTSPSAPPNRQQR